MNIFDLLIVQPIFNLLLGLYSIIPGGDFGVSLILFTIIVRFALYPLVKKQLHQTRMMRKLQPELVKIRKAAKGNRQIEGAKMLELYKEHGVSPFRSILILLIQLPIFIALYHVIQIFTQHRDRIDQFTYGFMHIFEPVRELIAHPEHFSEKLFGLVDLTHSAISSDHVDIILIVLALVSAVAQFFMSKQTMPQTENKKRLRDIMAEAADGKQADQAEMNAAVMGKMIKVLPFFMFFVMVSVPGALALYYCVSNLVALGQQAYLLRKDETELEELAEKDAPRPGKKATAKARAKVAHEADVVRIKAK